MFGRLFHILAPDMPNDLGQGSDARRSDDRPRVLVGCRFEFN